MFVFEQEHECFLVVFPYFVESEGSVVNLFGEILDTNGNYLEMGEFSDIVMGVVTVFDKAREII